MSQSNSNLNLNNEQLLLINILNNIVIIKRHYLLKSITQFKVTKKEMGNG